MGFVTRGTQSGLVLAEEAQDELRLSRALKQIDDKLVLQRHPGEVAGGWVYKVLKVVSEDQPAVRITTWADEYGHPLPLSSGLLDRVRAQMVGARNGVEDPDAFNQRLRERREAEKLAALEKISEEHRPKVERGQVTVSLGAGTSKRYWQRNLEGPRGSRGTAG